jgi:hypothetical protein
MVFDLSNICRLCLKCEQNGKMFSLFTEVQDENASLSSKVMAFTSVEKANCL